MKILTLIFFLLVSFSTSVHAQIITLLKGRIGKSPVVLQLTINNDSDAYVTYFYDQIKKDIQLSGKLQSNGVIRVESYNNNDQKFTAKYEKIEIIKLNNHYTGKWISTNKALTVALDRLSLQQVIQPYSTYAAVKELKYNPIDYVRTSGLSFIKDSTTKKAGYLLDWYHEKYSDISFVRLRKPIMTPAIKKVNRQLEEIHLQQSNGHLSCTSPANEGEYEQQIDHLFLKNNLFSIDVVTSYDCGGAHPDVSFNGFNFDLEKGSKIELDDVLWFGKGMKLRNESTEWYNYRSSVFAPSLVNILKEIYSKEIAQAKKDNECDYSQTDVWKFPNWYFTDKGLYLGASFARALRVCDEPEWSVIPYSIVKKHLSRELKIKLPE